MAESNRDDDRLKKIKLIMPVDDAVEAILDALPAFLHHVYVKRCQEVAYQQEIEEARRQNVQCKLTLLRTTHVHRIPFTKAAL